MSWPSIALETPGCIQAGGPKRIFRGQGLHSRSLTVGNAQQEEPVLARRATLSADPFLEPLSHLVTRQLPHTQDASHRFGRVETPAETTSSLVTASGGLRAGVGYELLEQTVAGLQLA